MRREESPDGGAAFAVGRLADAPRLVARHPRLKPAFDFIAAHDLSALPAGRYGIAGDDGYALVQEVELKPVADGRLELHRDYVDIQVPLDGPETFGLAAVSPPAFAAADWDARDVVFLDAPKETVTVRPGEFVLLFPLRGAHAPCLTDGLRRRIRKLVVKVRAAL